MAYYREVIPKYDMDPRKVKFPDQAIQWHLPHTRLDRCPRCGAGLGLLGRDRRACMGTGTEATPCPPGTVWGMQGDTHGVLYRDGQCR